MSSDEIQYLSHVSFLEEFGIQSLPSDNNNLPPPSHPFDGMHFESDDDLSSEEVDDDDNDEDYVDLESVQTAPHAPAPAPPQVPLHSRPSRPAPPPPTTTNVSRAQSQSQPATTSHTAPPVANAQHKGQHPLTSRPIILPQPNLNPSKQARPRQSRKSGGGASSGAALVASARPSNIKRVGAPSHRATLSVSSGGGGGGTAEPVDPAIPDPNEEGIVMIGVAQSHHLKFTDFGENMYLARKDFIDPMYPPHLEPPSKLSPLRCLCCKKQYNGPNARSMWRRHITQKHHFTLGGKKGNGKGRKADDEDENTLPEESHEDSMARRREQVLVQKREYARNRRVQTNGVTRPLLTSANSGPQDPNVNFFPHNNQWLNQPTGPFPTGGGWPISLGSVAAVNDGGGPNAHLDRPNFYFPNPSVSFPPPSLQQQPQQQQPHPQIQINVEHQEVIDDEDDEEDIPLCLISQGAGVSPNSLLAPSPVINSPNMRAFATLPFSAPTPVIAPAEPQLVQNEEDVKPDIIQNGLNGRQAFGSDFDFDLGTLHTEFMATSPVMPRSNQGQAYGGGFADTPNRDGRRGFLGLDSPTSFPGLKRSRSAMGQHAPLGSGAPAVHRPSLTSTPGQMFRSYTMPAVTLAGLASSPLGGLGSFLRSTPGRTLDSSSLPFDIFGSSGSPFKSWIQNDSPILKRKRNSTDDLPVSWLNRANDEDDKDDGILRADGTIDNALLDSWFDMPVSPIKATKKPSEAEERQPKKSRVSV